ncbi:MAG TPA: DUF4166 domain-containing protein [Beijerinckiaceae bacterium]|nr:DUF4166 domain-containing protein [Beijerinckiaceae bacterium]
MCAKHEPDFCILLIGAGGVFGSRLAEGLAAEGFADLVLAARRPERLQALAERLRGAGANPRVEIVALDRDRAPADDLRRLGAALVIDAAGPFEGGHLRLAEAAVEAGCHYIDLADARDFVAGIPALDERARAAGVAVLSGASSTPALSHAALDALTAGWRRIDRIAAAISPGNRAPRGLSVVEAILSRAGASVRVLRNGGWDERFGWGDTRRIEIPGLGQRWVSLCETPDLDLFVERYRPTTSAEFLAGLELSALHFGLAALSRSVRWRALPSLLPLARPLRWIADRMRALGSDRGGMLVEAIGLDAEGRACRAEWSLLAASGVGPYVPTIPPVAVARKFRDGSLRFRGASACVGFVTLEELAPSFERLGIETAVAREGLDEAAVFERALGGAFERLPAMTQAIHRPDPLLLLRGTAAATGGASPIARFVARLFGFPGTTGELPVRVVIERHGAGERWTRIFGDKTFVSFLDSPDAGASSIAERFGIMTFRVALGLDEKGLSFTPVKGWIGPVPLPRWMLPRVTAHESVTLDDAHHFDVRISLPVLGVLVHYRGALRIDEAEAPPADRLR